MSLWRYQISLLVLKNVSLVSAARVIFSRLKISSLHVKDHLFNLFIWFLTKISSTQYHAKPIVIYPVDSDLSILSNG